MQFLFWLISQQGVGPETQGYRWVEQSRNVFPVADTAAKSSQSSTNYLYRLFFPFDNFFFVFTSCQAVSPRRGLESPLCGDSAKPSGGGPWKPLFGPSRPSLHCQRGASNVHKATFLAAKNQCSIGKGKIRPHPPGTRNTRRWTGLPDRAGFPWPSFSGARNRAGTIPSHLLRLVCFARLGAKLACACFPRTHSRLRSDLDSAQALVLPEWM